MYKSLDRYANESSVTIFSLKPYCDDGSIEFSSRYLKRRFFIALSNILGKTFRNEIGLKLLMSDIIPPLCIGVIIDI